MLAADVRRVVADWIHGKINQSIKIGLPEYDGRIGQWRVSLLATQNGHEPVAEVRVADNEVVFSSDLSLVEERCNRAVNAPPTKSKTPISFPPVESRIIFGDSAEVLFEFPVAAAQLVFTSPPYFNARPEYHESIAYEDYLGLLKQVFTGCHRILAEGRFLVVNTSPVLVRRPHRQASSRRLPITYDLHGILDEIGFEFIDDIIWEKPEGAGWNLGRGRRFAADRQPLQYKAVSVTENLTVYRKRTDRLIDWNIRNHPEPEAVKRSLINDGYERTNIWRIHPANHRNHPAVFPDALAERVIRYYSFEGDMVLDPFAGTGTTGRQAVLLGRRFMLVDNAEEFVDLMRNDDELQKHSPIISYEFSAGAI